MAGLTGLFLGAGASYEAGMPLVWELTAEIKNWLTADKLRELNKGWRKQGEGFPDVVINDLVAMLERPDIHYEAILGNMEVQYRRNGELSQSYHGMYSWLVDLVYHLLYYRQIKNQLYLEKNLPFYDGMRVLAVANQPLWVFSLNHDVIVEIIAARLSLPLHCGFSSSTMTLPTRNAIGEIVGELKAEILTKEDLEQRAMYFPARGEPGINLLKIHGALDVFTFNNGEDLLRLLPNKPGPEGVIEVLKAANENLFYLLTGYPGGKVKTRNEITYADFGGEMQFLRRSLLAGAFKFDARTAQILPKAMLKHFEQNINFVSTLVCIGYGFGDIHINAVLRQWLELKPERRLEIVSPSAEMPAFLLHLSPQITIIKSGATDYLDANASIQRSSLQKAEKRLAAKVRSLNKDKVAKSLASFANQRIRRISDALLERLRSLPLKDGKPDLAALGDPEIAAKKILADTELKEEALIQGLVNQLESDDES